MARCGRRNEMKVVCSFTRRHFVYYLLIYPFNYGIRYGPTFDWYMQKMRVENLLPHLLTYPFFPGNLYVRHFPSVKNGSHRSLLLEEQVKGHAFSASFLHYLCCGSARILAKKSFQDSVCVFGLPEISVCSHLFVFNEFMLPISRFVFIILSGGLCWKLSIYVCGFVTLLFQVIGPIYTTMCGSPYVFSPIWGIARLLIFLLPFFLIIITVTVIWSSNNCKRT